MAKGKRGSGQAAAEKGRGSEKFDIPSEIRECINGRVVDLSSASEYYRRHWETVLPRVRGQLRDRNRFRYELNKQFFQFFISRLREVIVQRYGRPEMGAGDFVADALYRAGWLFGSTKKTRISGIDPGEIWQATRPISEAWQRLGRLPVPGETRGTVEIPETKAELRLPRPGEFYYPRIAMSLSCAQDRAALPKLTIEIEGESVCVLMKARYELEDPEERRAARKEARRIWNFLLKRLSVWAGIQEPRRGRPQEDLGSQAALLHDHHGLTWLQVAQQVCRKKHKHDTQCKENLRQQAKQFWKRLRKHALSLPPVNV